MSSRKIFIAKFILIFLVITSWLYSGWPQIAGFPPKIEKVSAAIASVGSLGSTNSEVANQTSIVLTTSATAEVDNMIVVVVAKDNIQITDGTTAGDVTSVTDTRSNSYTKAHEFTNAQGGQSKGAHVSVWFARAATELTSGDTITANFVSCDCNDKTAIRAWEFTVAAGNTFQVADTTELANDGADPGSMTSGTVASKEWLFFRGIAYESDIDVTSLTPTTNFTDIGVESTDGGGEAGNMGVTGEFRIVTATSETSDPTAVGDTTHDNASVFIVFEEIAPASTFEQRAYGWFSNADSSIPGSILAAQDTTSTLSVAGAKFRLRLLILIGSSNLAIDGENFKLQFAGKGGGTCPSPSFTYADVATTTAIAFFQNSHASTTDAAPLGPHDEDPTDGGSTIINQDYKEYRDFTNSEAGINTTENGKWDFSLYDNNATSSSTFCFRVVKSDDSTLDTYAVYPALIVATAATGGAGGSSDPSGGGTPTTGGGEGGDDATESGSGGGTPTTGGGEGGGDGASPTLLDLLNELIWW